MVEPDDFGLSPLATLAHVAASHPPSMFASFWSHWQQRVAAAKPRLVEFRTPSPDSTDSSATHWVESVAHVRVGCRLIEPPRGTPVHAALLTLHGYHAPTPLSGEDEEWAPLARRGLLVCAMRLRGYPGSRIDCADYTQEPGGWISRGLAVNVTKPQDAMDWSLVQGVADVACVARALRVDLDRRAGPDRPLMLHGWSFGGGVAVVAAAQMAAMNAGSDRVSRLCLGVPSLGDWAWRRSLGDRACRTGIGADVAFTLKAHALNDEQLLSTLSLGDAALHARHVSADTLALLALRDDTVPAPSSAAIINALATDPGRRWRFLTPYGHFDGGLRNARRHALFEACRQDFLDPTCDPGQAMARWEPMLEHGERRPESARA